MYQPLWFIFKGANYLGQFFSFDALYFTSKQLSLKPSVVNDTPNPPVGNRMECAVGSTGKVGKIT